jgi:hypothetical protein
MGAMPCYIIDTDNNITAFAEGKDAPAAGETSTSFGTEREFDKVTAEWPISRFVETWNAFAGVVPFDDINPVKKFTDRKTAVARIWKTIQRLAPVAERVAQGAPVGTNATTETSTAKRTPRAARKAKAAPKKLAAKPASQTREGSKSAVILSMITKGATLRDLMAAAGWQPHSVRGFLSTAAKKQGIKIDSTRNKDGERFYKLVK